MRLDEKSIHDLVVDIYDGATDSARWEQALVRLSDSTHSVGAMVRHCDRLHPERSRCFLGRLDVVLTHRFFKCYASRAPWVRWANNALPGTTFSTDRVVPTEELVKTEFYGEILRPQRILHGGGALLARDSERVLAISLLRSPGIGPVDEEPLRLLSLVGPHFKRAAQIAWRLGTLTAVDAAKTFALDGLDHGVLLIDAGGRVLFANRAAPAGWWRLTS